MNEVKYGKMKAGDPVLVDNGTVYVANKLRQGIPMSEDEIMEYALVKESTEKLGGYEVTVRPGARFHSSTHLFGRHSWNVGKTKVSIKKNKLFVNGRSYGSLKEGDKILIEHGKVFVSGNIREVIK